MFLWIYATWSVGTPRIKDHRGLRLRSGNAATSVSAKREILPNTVSCLSEHGGHPRSFQSLSSRIK